MASNLRFAFYIFLSILSMCTALQNKDDLAHRGKLEVIDLPTTTSCEGSNSGGHGGESSSGCGSGCGCCGCCGSCSGYGGCGSVYPSYCSYGSPSPQECFPSSECPSLGNIRLPYRNNCSLYCQCEKGVAKTFVCPPDQHFSAQHERCVDPVTAQCEKGCPKLDSGNAMRWSPASCTLTSSKIGDVCQISCDQGFELKGSNKLECTQKGWNGSGGLNQIPSCKTPAGIGEDLVVKLEDAGIRKGADLLFILDESGSVVKEQFLMEISFVKAVVKAFPLSQNRTAGVITFSSGADVDITMDHKDTCEFLKLTDGIIYSGGGTDIQRALKVANNHIASHAVNNFTVILLITDGESSTNPTSEADIAKSKGNVLFTVGVGDYNRQQLEPISSLDSKGAPLFYGITDFKVFNSVAEYLHSVFGDGGLKCP